MLQSKLQKINPYLKQRRSKKHNMNKTTSFTFNKLYRKYCSKEAHTQFCKLWHYTSADGLVGIIKNESDEHGHLHFWFTRSDCLNDISEGNHILHLFQNVCAELLQQKAISAAFYDAIHNAEIPDSQFINFPIPPREDFVHESVLDCVPCHAFICSFSLKEDSLDMWRYYSKGNGGYGLKCHSLLFDKYKGYEYSNYKEDELFSLIKSYKVIYNDSEKFRILRDIIVDTFSAFQNSDQPSYNKKQVAKGFIQYALKSFQFQFKHECYSSEQEYRFVFYLPDKKPERLKNKMPSIKYRTQNGIPIPYIDLIVEDGSSCLEEVLISPFIDSESVINTTNDYLTQCGFNCTSRKSELPVRK